MKERRSLARPSVIIAVIVAVAVLTAVFSHGLRVRFIWGGSGFVAGILCGALLTVEIQHRWRKRHQETRHQET